MTKTIVLLAVVVALYSTTLSAQSAQAPRSSVRPPTPTAAPASALLAERFTRLDRLLQQYVDESRIAGAVALVLQDGQIVCGEIDDLICKTSAPGYQAKHVDKASWA